MGIKIAINFLQLLKLNTQLTMKTTSLSFVLMLFGISVMAQSSIDLKLNLEKNIIYRFKSASEQNISQTVNGVQQNTSVKASSTMSIKMIDTTPEFIIAEVRFDTIVTNTNAMGVNTNMNSTNEGNIKSSSMSDVMSCVMNRLSKNGLYVKMDYTGKVIELINSKMLLDIILKDTSSIAGQNASMMKTQVKNLVSDKALKLMVESFTSNLPGKQVAAGDQWDASVTSNSGGMSLDILTNYILGDIKGNVASIAAEANIKASENATPMEYSGARITYGDIKGISKSNMMVDIRTGLLLESKAKTHITGNLNVAAPGVNMEIPMEIDSESTVLALP